ncbi:hypothetical protein [Novipirellula artificiosorum]|uniref:Uncharacterized protein n=1 Tax=Novipirellula artificiosorum TaxID=2528016 RepID=A0A5C6D7N9_9BACT|nr:hypothetical protein [Novipirellula artificiosorum]TWU31727.1 hypothetical protein Poly41_59620 [Novipirellula artificiosorum]
MTWCNMPAMRFELPGPIVEPHSEFLGYGDANPFAAESYEEASF